ncbi:MAG TPA: hypothetical protein VJT09_18315 [Pyrinomonadaceae bacterium]|nr:hypothetical protein [Pyrinomonadaceae bacterium]
MPSQSKKPFYLLIILALLVLTGLAFARAGRNTVTGAVSLAPLNPPEKTEQAAQSRNLSLQPQAFTLSRRLGKRFSHAAREQSVLVGMLTTGPETKAVQVMRRQTDDGEQVEINLAGARGPLTWDAGQGAQGAGEKTASDRDIIERLVLDSPDQFVLAQLRGASYRTIARNVGPEEGVDGYDGPLWDIVRIDDPQRDEQKRALSPWRLYYINTRTGLIDRIVSEIEGEKIEAALSGWTEVNGETFPSEIIWTRQGQTLMQFRLTNFSHAG